MEERWGEGSYFLCRGPAPPLWFVPSIASPKVLSFYSLSTHWEERVKVRGDRKNF
jgi:hypothetical protein